MIAFDVDVSKLNETIARLSDADDIMREEFSAASELVRDDVVKEMKTTPASVSGRTVASIGGDIRPLTGPDVETRLKAGGFGGFDYPAMLDQKGGRRQWRSGRFSGRRTHGWWTKIVPQIVAGSAETHFGDAAERIAERLAP